MSPRYHHAGLVAISNTVKVRKPSVPCVLKPLATPDVATPDARLDQIGTVPACPYLAGHLGQQISLGDCANE